MTGFQQRQLFQKAEDTLNNTKQASQQLAQTTQQVNSTLNEAFNPDPNGPTAGANLSETLSNVNVATANIADDTEATPPAAAGKSSWDGACVVFPTEGK